MYKIFIYYCETTLLNDTFKQNAEKINLYTPSNYQHKL